jgi:hypothetical protein
MGIDIYARWKGQTRRERKDQQTGFSTIHGHTGYLREAYHGGPYVTRFLVREAFETDDCEAHIPAAVLKSRLPQAVVLSLIRHQLVYNDQVPHMLNAEKPEEIIAAVAKMFAAGGEVEQARKGEEGDRLARSMPLELVKETIERIASRNLPEFALSFVDFVSLCERKEAQTGEPCLIYASY